MNTLRGMRYENVAALNASRAVVMMMMLPPNAIASQTK